MKCQTDENKHCLSLCSANAGTKIGDYGERIAILDMLDCGDDNHVCI